MLQNQNLKDRVKPLLPFLTVPTVFFDLESTGTDPQTARVCSICAILVFPLNPAGTAIVALGQHKNVWKLGYHQGKPDRPALVQCGAFQVYRDNNRDAKIDLTHLQTAKTGGINLHWSYAPKEATTIGKSSAGCQVVKNEAALLRILEMVKETGLPTVTYTLFSSTELAAA